MIQVKVEAPVKVIDSWFCCSNDIYNGNDNDKSSEFCVIFKHNQIGSALIN